MSTPLDTKAPTAMVLPVRVLAKPRGPGTPPLALLTAIPLIGTAVAALSRGLRSLMALPSRFGAQASSPDLFVKL